jgi:hypothetical protein
MKKRSIVMFALAIGLALFLAVPQGYAQTEQGETQPGYGYGMGPGMMGPGYGYGTGPGMMGPGYGYGMGPGMMGPGYGMGPGMMGRGYGMGPGMMGPGYGYGMGPGMMGRGYGMGPGMMGPGYGYGYGMGPQSGQPYGRQYQQQKPIDEKEAKALLENYLASAGNPNLKLGKIEDKGDAFVGDIVTVKGGALVDQIAINKHTGWMHPVR